MGFKPDESCKTVGVTSWKCARSRKVDTNVIIKQSIGSEVVVWKYAIANAGIHWEKPVFNMVEGPTTISQKNGGPLRSSGGGRNNRFRRQFFNIIVQQLVDVLEAAVATRSPDLCWIAFKLALTYISFRWCLDQRPAS